jgi:hypothetical protein
MKKTRVVALGIVILLALLVGGVAWALSPAASDIDWRVFSGGGAPASSSSGVVSVNSSLGQTAIGLSSSSSYNLSSGYWYSSGATFSYVYLPFVARGFASLPDLVVERVVVAPNQAQVVIKNAGNASVPDDSDYEFWVDLYVNPGRAPGYNETCQTMGCQGAVWGITASGSPGTPVDPARQALPLEPGEVFTLTTGGDYYWLSGSTIVWPLDAGDVIYAQVDSVNPYTTYGAVPELDEGNNVSIPPATVTGAGVTSLPPVTGEGTVQESDRTSLPSRP